MSFKNGTQSTEPQVVPTATLGSSEGPNRITFYLGEATKLIWRSLVEEPKPENVKAFSFLDRVLSSLVDNLAFLYNYLEDAILYSLWHSPQVSLCLFFFLFFMVSNPFVTYTSFLLHCLG